MPHYRDGTVAAVGDIVKDCSAYYGEMNRVGEVLSITPGATSCNANVAFIEDVTHPKSNFIQPAVVFNRPYDGGKTPPSLRALSLNTVTLGEMELIHRPSGAALAQEAPAVEAA